MGKYGIGKPGVHDTGPVVSENGFRVGDKKSSTEVIDKDSVIQASLKEDVLRVASISVSNDEIKNLNTAAKELVAAPGADKLIEFVSATLVHDYGINALTGEHALTIGWDDGSVAAAATVAHGDFAHKEADHIVNVQPALETDATAASVANKNLAITSAGDYAGNADNDTVWTIKVAYRVLTLGLA